MPVAVNKFSQISAAGGDLSDSDSVLAVQGGTTDVLFTAAQVFNYFQTFKFSQIDKGTISSGTVTFDISLNTKGRLQVGGALTVAFSNWPASGIYAEFEIQLVNAGTNVTWPTVNWLKGDGTNSTTFSTMGVTLYASGTNTVIVWSTDGGTTLYGKAA